MGGAIAVRLAAAGLIKSLVGLAVIDVVEGTALQSLSGMQSFLRGRPTSFRSLDQAIEWSIRSGQLRNIESAKVSMPGQLMRIDKTDTDGCTDDNVMYQWRVDLTSTEKYWKEWFQGLSSVLLSTSTPTILLLAGVDRLDKELTIGHMQGKFQMQVLSGCGHAVHEDVPDQVAKIVAGFMVRYKLAAPKESFQRISPAC
jgi:protein phosphatase methylesterase 1